MLAYMAQQPNIRPSAGGPPQPSSNPQSTPALHTFQPQAGQNPLLVGQMPPGTALQTLLAAMQQQQPQPPIHSNILEQIRALAPQVQPRPSVPLPQRAPTPTIYNVAQARPAQPYRPTLPQANLLQAAGSRPLSAAPPRASLPLSQAGPQAFPPRPYPRPYQPLTGVSGQGHSIRPSVPSQPLSEEDLRLLPLQSINRMARAAFGPDSGISEEVETALMELADQWVTSALTLGSGAARKRKASTLMPEDVAKCMEPIWNIHVPGAGPDTISMQKRSTAPELHQTRAKAVRRAIAQASAAEPGAVPASSTSVAGP